MNRDKFLKYAKEFDDNYCVAKTLGEDSTRDYPNKTIKEAILARHESPPIQWYSQIKYSKIEHITLSNNNCFEPFYSFDDKGLYNLFGILHKTGMLLEYFDKYSLDILRTTREQEALAKHYDKVIADVEAKYFDEKEILDFLQNRSDYLKTKVNYISKRNIFENLLVSIIILLAQNEKDYKLTEKKVEIVNKIIYDYYDEENIRFSRKININNFIKSVYTFEIATKIEITHSKKG